MTSMIKNLWPTEVMFDKLDDNVTSDVVYEILSNLDLLLIPGEISDTNLTNEKFGLTALQNFVNTTVFDTFNSYSKQVFDYELSRDVCEMKVWASNGMGKYSLGFHNHSGSQLSAIFYLLVDPSPSAGGKISFHDPRFNANRGMITPFKTKHSDLVIAPKTGDVIVFPSYLYHSISTFHGSTRLILPVDLFIRD